MQAVMVTEDREDEGLWLVQVEASEVRKPRDVLVRAARIPPETIHR
jgi:hypothetical protein